jgi:hypothetical protein
LSLVQSEEAAAVRPLPDFAGAVIKPSANP